MRFQPSLFILAAAVAFPAVPAAAAADTDDSQKMVCKNQAKTGTRFPRKICHTKAEWDRLTEEHRRNAAEHINRPMIDTRRGN